MYQRIIYYPIFDKIDEAYKYKDTTSEQVVLWTNNPTYVELSERVISGIKQQATEYREDVTSQW